MEAGEDLVELRAADGLVQYLGEDGAVIDPYLHAARRRGPDPARAMGR